MNKRDLWLWVVLFLVGVTVFCVILAAWPALEKPAVPENSLGPGTLIIDQIQGGDGEFSILYWEYVDDGTQWVTVTSEDGLYSWTQELRGVER